MNDLQKPVAIARGSMVSVVLKTPAMLLTTQGRALDDGAIGDVIRVLNTRSNMTVQGTVSASGEVIVSPAGSLALN
jgi:flagella basal body P-ring formation protein FlgA